MVNFASNEATNSSIIIVFDKDDHKISSLFDTNLVVVRVEKFLWV